MRASSTCFCGVVTGSMRALCTSRPGLSRCGTASTMTCTGSGSGACAGAAVGRARAATAARIFSMGAPRQVRGERRRSAAVDARRSIKPSTGSDDRHGLTQPPADTDRLHADSQAGAIVGLDVDAADGGGAVGGGVAAAGEAGGEAPQGLFLVVADDGVVVAAAPGVGLVGGAARQDLAVGGRDVGVGADHEAGAAVAEMAHGHLLGGRLGVHVD